MGRTAISPTWGRVGGCVNTSVFSGTVYGDVTSANVVGYENYTVQGKVAGVQQWYQIAIQFKSVNETTDRITVCDALKSADLTPVAWALRNKTDGTGGATVEVWNGTKYDYYYYTTEAYPTTADKKAKTNLKTAWATSGQLVAEEVNNAFVKPGDAFWLKVDNLTDAQTATINVAGEVISGNSRTLDVGVLGAGEWTALSNPFPVDVEINSIACTVAPAEWALRNKTDGTGCPTIEIWNGKKYDYFYYTTEAYPTTADKKAKTNLTTGWATSGQLLANTENSGILRAGTAFWFRTAKIGTGTITFTIPGLK